MESIPKKYGSPNYYVSSIVIFQTYKNTILNSVHSLGWFFYCDFTLGLKFITWSVGHMCKK